MSLPWDNDLFVRTWICCATLSALGALIPALAAAQANTLLPREWRAIYRETGGIALAPPLSAHYGGDRDVGELTAGSTALDIVQRQSHWRKYFNDRPRMLLAPRVAGWAGLTRRLRVGGHATYMPRLDALALSNDLAVHVVMGHAERGAFTVIAGSGWLVAPQFWLAAPHLALRGDTEIGRTAHTHGGPWVFYFAARLDIGYRIARRRDGSSAIDNNNFMEPVIAVELLATHGPLVLGYGFAGQSLAAEAPTRRVFIHELRLAWRWTRSVTPQSP